MHTLVSRPAPPTSHTACHHLDGCRDYGLTCETHAVETEDGYQLAAHRVLVPPGVPRRGALLAVSGLICCSDSFLLLHPGRSMLKPLSEAGYDVTLGNLRGSTYATGHGCSQQRNCRFNLDDMGEYDVEALVGLTQRVTGDARPFYLGHSSGGGALYTWLQRRPRAHHVLRGALLWTPSVFYTEPHSTILKIYHLLPESLLKRLPEIVSHTSCGLPTTTYAHYLQNIRAKRLQAFDFGREENLSKYGSERPPAYHVVNSTLPTAFFLGTRDRLVSFEVRSAGVHCYYYYHIYYYCQVTSTQ
ncbi:lipase member K-like isoform X2 [Schistocerca americana]|uniref:lipase member K-like isoform X2 n=1 Tax=Schistocerca americana TaxID=7009 RepID=UPI001F4F4F2A|nr:lipase member K-like isoform X2 [Schistocerca americana]